MKRIFSWIVKTGLIISLIAIALLTGWAFQSRGMPALQIWHTEVLESEFIAADAAPDTTLPQYLEQEARLFAEVQEKIYGR